MPAVFISHSSLDKKASDDIKAWLASLGFERVFLDFDKDSGIGVSENWERRLHNEIARCHAIILVLTPSWLASKWCFAELIQARALGKVILPVICSPIGDYKVLPEIQATDLIDWNTDGLQRIEKRLQAITDELARGFVLDPMRPPYPGIYAFEGDDAAIYFGRDEETLAVIEKLDARRTQGGARLLLIISASGAGKSSLLKAGVLPQLSRRQRHWIVLPPMRPQTAPLESLAKAIAQHAGTPGAWQGWHDKFKSGEAVNALATLARDLRVGEASTATLLLPVDQFEEAFTIAQPGEREGFLAVLAAALDPARDLPLRVLATGRADVLQGMLEGSALSALTETVPLRPMPLERVPRLVEGPASVAAIGVEKGLAEEIARDVGTPEALPLLAYMLHKLNERCAREKRLTVAAYHALGDAAHGLNPVQNAVRLGADQAIGLKPDPSTEELAALRDAFVPHLVRLRLDDGRRMRQPARLDDLPSQSQRLVRALVEARLLSVRAADGGATIEVAHEALFDAWPTLKSWLDEEQSFLADTARLKSELETWEAAPAAEKPQALLHGLLLQRARDWLTRHPGRFASRGMEPLRAFIAESAAAQDAERQRAAEQAAKTRRMEKRLVRGAAAASLVLAVLAAAALFEARIAVTSQALAERNFDLTIENTDALVAKISTELKDRIGISQDVIRRILGLIENQYNRLKAASDKSQMLNPRLQLGRADMLSALVDNYIDLGDLGEAERHARECIVTMAPLAVPDSSPETQEGMGQCLEKLAFTQLQNLQVDDAVKTYRESLDLRTKVRDGAPQNDAYEFALCHVLAYYAYALLTAGSLDQAIAPAEASIAISSGHVKAGKDVARWQRELVEGLNFKSMALMGKNLPANALPGYQQARQLTHALLDNDKDNATLQRFYSNLLSNLSRALIGLNRDADAANLLQQSLTLKRRLVGTDPQNSTWQWEMCVTLIGIGNDEFRNNQAGAAVKTLQQARAVLDGLLTHNPANGLWQFNLMETTWLIAVADVKNNDLAGARGAAQTGLAAIAKIGEQGHGKLLGDEIALAKNQLTTILGASP